MGDEKFITCLFGEQYFCPNGCSKQDEEGNTYRICGSCAVAHDLFGIPTSDLTSWETKRLDKMRIYDDSKNAIGARIDFGLYTIDVFRNSDDRNR